MGVFGRRHITWNEESQEIVQLDFAVLVEVQGQQHLVQLGLFQLVQLATAAGASYAYSDASGAAAVSARGSPPLVAGRGGGGGVSVVSALKQESAYLVGRQYALRGFSGHHPEKGEKLH